MKKLWLVPVLLVGLPLLAWVVAVNASDLRGAHNIFEVQLPGDFSGWAVLRHEVAGAPPLPFAPAAIGGTYTVRIPASGRLDTRSASYEGRYTEKLFRAERGGALLIAWDPAPGAVRESRSGKCWLWYVAPKPLRDDEDTPPPPPCE